MKKREKYIERHSAMLDLLTGVTDAIPDWYLRLQDDRGNLSDWIRVRMSLDHSTFRFSNVDEVVFVISDRRTWNWRRIWNWIKHPRAVRDTSIPVPKLKAPCTIVKLHMYDHEKRWLATSELITEHFSFGGTYTLTDFNLDME